MVTDYEKLVIGEYHEQKGFKEGREEGREEGRKEVIQALISSGMSLQEIQHRLNLSAGKAGQDEAKTL